MEIPFKKIELDDQEIISRYFKQANKRACEYSFTNTFLWSRHYKVTYTVLEEMLVFKSEDGGLAFSFPLGAEENLEKVIGILKEYSREKGSEFRMYGVLEDQFEVLGRVCPGEYEIEYNRDAADYVYEAEKLSTLSGKKYHGKRNHINKFLERYPDWSYEQLDDEKAEECFQMALKWRADNGCEEDPEKNAEMCVTLNSLRLYKELGLRGGLLRIEGEVAAFSIGEPVSDDTVVVHIEKAHAEIQGAYPMINKQFVLHEAEGFTYINREEDMGVEGLRKAKLSYRPVFLVEKGIVKQKEV